MKVVTVVRARPW